MAKPKSERVKRMMAEFMQWHNEGYSIPQIAVIFNLSWSSVYKNLQAIADANGVPRTSLLQIVRTKSNETFIREEEKKVHVDVQELRNSFSNARMAISRICNKINNIIIEE